MFTNELSGDWSSTKHEGAFVKQYSGQNKFRPIKTHRKSKQLDNSKNIHAVTNSKNVPMKQDTQNDWNDSVSCNPFRNKRTLNDQSYFCKKKKKKLFNNASQDNLVKICENDSKLQKVPNEIKTKKKRKKSKKKNKCISDKITMQQINNSMEFPAVATEGPVDMLSSDLPVRKKKFFQNKMQKKFKDSFIEIHENDSEFRKDSNNLKRKKKRRIKNKNKCISGEGIIQQTSNSMEFSSKAEKVVGVLHCDTPVKKSSLFQNKIRQKLQAAKFRYLNEILYTNPGKDALSYFQENTDEFKDYHEGYQLQVSKWPINPVDVFIQEIRQMNSQAIIADLGCGEAKIAEVFPKRTVHSFDLIALKDNVTACDIAKVPLPNNSVDVVVFCLSLMGTNWKDYVKEGHRILKPDGQLKIAEIESRIENLHYFIKNIENKGFSMINKNMSHKMFVFLNFKKIKRSKKSNVPDVTLKPCLYKKR